MAQRSLDGVISAGAATQGGFDTRVLFLGGAAVLAALGVVEMLKNMSPEIANALGDAWGKNFDTKEASDATEVTKPASGDEDGHKQKEKCTLCDRPATNGTLCWVHAGSAD
ncbi:MAG: hypothetical protein AAB439_03105 [Patescibacteria group bacterium]